MNYVYILQNASENIDNNRTNIYAIPVINSKINKRSKFAHVKRSAEIMDEKIINNEDEIMTEDFSPSVKSTVAKNIANYSIFSLRNIYNLTSYGDIKIPQNVPKDTKTNGKIFTVVRHIL